MAKRCVTLTFCIEMLSAVNGAGLTIAVGCVIGALGIGLLAIFGFAMLHTYERYADPPTRLSTLTLRSDMPGSPKRLPS